MIQGMTDEREPVVQKETKMGKRTIIASVAGVIGAAALAYALLLHPSCAYRNSYVQEANKCGVQRVTCHGIFCSPQTDEVLSCGEHTNACGVRVDCGCTDENTTDWE